VGQRKVRLTIFAITLSAVGQFSFLAQIRYRKFATGGYIVSPPNMVSRQQSAFIQQQILYDHGQHSNNVPLSVLCCSLTWVITKVQIFSYLLLLMVVNMYKHTGKVVIKILQGTNHVRWANYTSSSCKFLIVYIAKNCENWLAVDKVIAKIIRLTFFGPPCTFIMYIIINVKDHHVISKNGLRQKLNFKLSKTLKCQLSTKYL